MAHIQGLSFSLSFSLSRASSFFLSFQIPLYVSRVRTGVHANSRVFPFLSLPSHSLSESSFVSSRTRTYVHTRIFAHAIHVIFLLPPSHVHELISLSLSSESLGEHPCTFFGTEPSPLVLFLDFLLLLVQHTPLTEPSTVAARKASSWHLNRSTRARRATLLRIRSKK